MSIATRRASPPRCRWRKAVGRTGILAALLFYAACGLFEDSANERTATRDAAGLAAHHSRVFEVWPAGDVAGPWPLPRGKARTDPAFKPVIPYQAVSGLLGSERSDVLAKLGRPALRTEIGLAQRWQYDGADCTVDILFFYDTSSRRFRLAAIRAARRPADYAGANHCLLSPSELRLS